MKKKRLVPAVAGFFLVSSVLFCASADPYRHSSQDEHKEFWQIVETVRDILAGENIENSRTSIAKNARIIYGTKSANLRSVVAGENKAFLLADTSYHGAALDAQTNGAEDMGLLVLKTRKIDTTKVRFHTVVFLKDSTGQFKIISWHTGD